MFAIVVLSYNHPELTARAVESALNLHEKLYLVHNGSEKKFVDGLRAKFPEVRHLNLEQNRGYSGGVNFGLKEAFKENDWVILLTNDCVLKNLPSPPLMPALVAPHILIKKTGRTDSLGGKFTPHLGLLQHCKSADEFTKAHRRYIPGSAFLIHRDVFESVGEFDESLGTYWEDVDYSQRASRFLKVDQSWLIEHGRGKTCHKHRHYTLYLYQRNRKRISQKYTSTLYRPLLSLNLWRTWAKLGLQLILNKRRADLWILFRAIKD